MKAHISKVIQAAIKKCLAMRRLRGVRPKQMRQLYKAVIAPTIDYAASTWFARGRRGMQDHINRLNRVQRLGAQAVIGAFRTVSAAVLQDEAGIEAVESRLAWKTTRHTLENRSLPETHPLCSIMNNMLQRPARHQSPLYQTWARYRATIPRRKPCGPTSKIPYVLSPWHDLQGVLVIGTEAEAYRLHQRLLTSATKYPLLYTDASVRNGLAGLSVVMYDRQSRNPKYQVVHDETVGREETCTATTAELCAIKAAVEFLHGSKKMGWIMTDSQEAPRLIDGCGRSTKSREVVVAILRELQVIRDVGLYVKILWIPGHKGIEGNERAHRAAQQTTAIGRRPTAAVGKRAKDSRLALRVLAKAVQADKPKSTLIWGRYTYTMDSALPGRHTLQLYGSLSREEASILAQARTGHTHLNEFRARIKQVDSALCECSNGVESVQHVVLQCPIWREQRQRLKNVAGNRWGDMSFLLGGKSRRSDPRSGRPMDGDGWKPDMKVIRETIAFLKSTGRFSAQAQNPTFS